MAQVIHISLTLLHIMYYQIVRDVFGVFGCTLYDKGDDRWYLNAAPWIQCSPSSDEYIKMLALSVPVFLLFVVALPWLVWKVMRDIRISEAMAMASRDERYGFLYLPFRPECQFWELVILGRRIAFSLVITIVPYTSQAILYLLIILVIQVSIWLQQIYAPYKTALENHMEASSLFVIFVSFFSALLGSYQETGEWIGAVIVALNSLLFVSFGLIVLASKVGLSGRIYVRRLSNYVLWTPPPDEADGRDAY